MKTDISEENDLLKWSDLWSRSIILKWSFEANDLDHFFDLDLRSRSFKKWTFTTLDRMKTAVVHWEYITHLSSQVGPLLRRRVGTSLFERLQLGHRRRHQRGRRSGLVLILILMPRDLDPASRWRRTNGMLLWRQRRRRWRCRTASLRHGSKPGRHQHFAVVHRSPACSNASYFGIVIKADLKMRSEMTLNKSKQAQESAINYANYAQQLHVLCDHLHYGEVQHACASRICRRRRLWARCIVSCIWPVCDSARPSSSRGRRRRMGVPDPPRPSPATFLTCSFIPREDEIVIWDSFTLVRFTVCFFINELKCQTSWQKNWTSSGPNRPAAAIRGAIFQDLWLHRTNFSLMLEDGEHPVEIWFVVRR